MTVNEVWILGGAGRSGSAVAKALVAMQVPVVLVGRNRAQLEEIAAKLGGSARVVVAASVEATAAALAKAKPAVVFNTIGPFTETALPIIRACAPSGHYLDLSNELPSIIAVLGLHDEAAAAGRCLVAGAGFGVLATESVVLTLCRDQLAPTRVRVDAMAVVSESGIVGEALAGSLIDSFAVGGRIYRRGRLVRARLGAYFERITLPDGAIVGAASGPTGELEAARRASNAPNVIAASGFVPASPAIRALLPLVVATLRIPALARFAKRRFARVEISGEQVRKISWARACVEWPRGKTRIGWLKTGDGSDFTNAVATEVAARLARGEGRPGAYTPGALFGPELALKAGGEFVLDQE